MFSTKKWQNNTIITKKNEKILISDGVFFFGKFYFLTGVILKFFQKSNSSIENNLFLKFLRKRFTKNLKIMASRILIKHFLTYFITPRIFFFKKTYFFQLYTVKTNKNSNFCKTTECCEFFDTKNIKIGFKYLEIPI